MIMSFINNLPVSRKLFAAFAAVFVAIASMGAMIGYSLWQLVSLWEQHSVCEQLPLSLCLSVSLCVRQWDCLWQL
jgi:hypothetical protein